MIEPGGTIGILGGGQLGRMLAMAAAQIGYRCISYTPENDHVVGDVCQDVFVNNWDDAQAMAAFAKKCDVVTWEFENVPVEPLRPLEDRLAPHPRALETAQDRLNEKRFIERLGGRPAPFVTVDSREDLRQAVERLGTPGILKTRRDGYDGKGQWRIDVARDVEGIAVPDTACVYEGFVTFEAEFSVILARAASGARVFWDSPANVHRDGILSTSSLPSGKTIEAQIEEARALAAQVSDALGYVGVLTLEFFATKEGPVFNEMAPRVHNSGHWTIEGAATSQFENHIRAICGLPLGDTRTIAPGVEMTNIVGKDAHTAANWLDQADTHLHLYGKAKARKGRKMGHATRLIWD
ncbi:MAG: 5-(carboxyamino)imidazole ribonucleotide synthase [Sphingomonadaceae bacterium]|nr:MAG: 5-(carboxyamino)imidazole ribonucleotide synthase [Sphingomonadaceae bacterium]